MKTTKKSRKATESALKFFCILFAAVFCVIVISVFAAFVLRDDKDISENENRVLAKKPVLTLSGIADGSYMRNFESWLSDQFPLRDKIISFKTILDRMCGKKEENGVYFGKDGFLFEKQSPFDSEKVSELTNAVNTFSKKYKNVNSAVLISPNSSSLLSEYLPNNVTFDSQKEQLAKMKEQLSGGKTKWVDCFEIFSKQKDKTKLFYRTDHHWTTLAAYDAFEALMKNWKIDTSKTNFKFSTVSSDFQGTLSSSSSVVGTTDEIQICTPERKDISYIVSYESSSKTKASLFEKEKLSTKNQYEVFLGGNYDKVVITTTVNTNDVLLLVKDSYANCMIPMLTPFFAKIVVIDPRYSSDALSSVMEEYDFTHMLFLYNLNTLLEDTSLIGALG